MPKLISRGKDCAIVPSDAALWTSSITLMKGTTLAVECPLETLRLHLRGSSRVVLRAHVQRLELETSVPDGVSVMLEEDHAADVVDPWPGVSVQRM